MFILCHNRTSKKIHIMSGKEFAPVSNSQRIEYIDIMRGIAIFGILIANLRWFTLYTPGFDGAFVYPGIDELIHRLQHIFIEGKFYSIFSMLFGWGIALQMKRSKKEDALTAKFIRRRLFFMLLLGGIHLFFIWEGDIVFLYGLVGFVLLSLRKLSNKALVITGIALLLSPVLLYALKMNFQWLNYPSEFLSHMGKKFYQLNGWIDQDTSRTAVLRDDTSLSSLLKITWGDAPYRFAYLFFVSRIPKVLGAMVIGFVIGRSGLIEKVKQYKTTLILVSVIGLIIYVPLNYILITYFENDAAYYGLQIRGLYYAIFYAFTVFPLAIVYMITLALLLESTWINKILHPIAAVGKTAFSNYVMHSVVGIIVFYGIGFGLMQQFGPLAWTFFAIVLFTIQVIASNIWLRYFRFGPIEWIWRSLTYHKVQKLRK